MPNSMVPTRMFLTKGVGRHKYQLKSFEDALRQAGVAQQNLVQVSSILPPHCKIIRREQGIELLKPGAISFCVMARCDTNEHGRLIASSVGVAIPKNRKKWGYLSEVHGHGMKKKEAEDMAEDLAAGMLGTTLGIELDPDLAWSEKEQAYKSSGLFVKTTNITQTATGRKGLWTTTVALAVFIFD
ncbi:MAG TPA: arginine decarboxylase, pyruvoyl-dependent [Anaerohalosphaeraceae bacterium]|nr:arginine decarboxylase, pyruvoyl-dependent [Anaerohalosphaeraceae bacterium]HOL32306.1 arginine decarboxylase, pyruvoyl-dependent [Anaerohalosphaeraceae bacterium]HOM75361.1 arginine decarboxylase, pyruvoyl-dependent [Anaerohalosphaeraceae bacterium]HPC64241.1 arginine decarboxylase, pyruvoyl-dependent [Anaerohalosphaeraceae bacterium]HPO69345.1 arginine decarboxylase, pyruvoyl-dependent [Anaerohalosphaeraceae bacterium]